MTFRMRAVILVSSVASAAALAIACGSSEDRSTFRVLEPAAPDADVPAPGDAGPAVRNDFKDPIFADGATTSAPAVFAKPDVAPPAVSPDAGPGASPTGPCLYEPELGSLFPNNWLRPRFRFTASAAENLFEIKLVVPNQASPLVVYTTKSGYALEKAIWEIVTSTGSGTVRVTVRSAVVDAAGNATAGPFKGSEGDIEVAPPQVQATGSVLYWTTSGGTVLKGFKVGDETVQPVITPAAAQTACVACHTSTPDGLYAGLTVSANAGDGSPGAIAIRAVDGTAAEPPFLTAQAKSLLARTGQHAPTFSKAHWKAGDHVVLSMMPVVNNKTEIIWTDLEAKDPAQGVGWNILARAGDNGHASGAVFAHDGARLAYVSTNGTGAGVIANEGRIFTVPYGNRQGGPATALPGASDPAFNQYYPTFSSDDALVAFNRIPTGASSYNAAAAEVFVVPSAGGTATRLAANDPPACLTTKRSPGITNSWPKWSPEVRSANGKSYYFLVFSSTRNPSSTGPQLYVAPIVVDGATVKTYAALYLWNQPETENNHTPAWDVFQLPGPK